jgi:hypothetical protein
VGATWIGGGIAGTIDLLRAAVPDDGLLLVGEPFWHEPPPEEACAALQVAPDEFSSLAGTLERFLAAGADLVEMVLADADCWDRFAAAQWWTLAEWLRAHPGDGRRDTVRAFRNTTRAAYLAYGRRYLGWGVFVLRPALPS